MFLRCKQDAFSLIDKLWKNYHLKFINENIDRKIFDINALTFGVDEELDNLVVFFNPNTGLEFYPDMAQFISGSSYYNSNAETNIEFFIMDEKTSRDFLAYIVEKRLIEIEPIHGVGGYNYVWSHIDFLLRYWKKEKYKSEPVFYI